MLRLEGYVTRLPDGLIAKMDEFEFGLEPADDARIVQALSSFDPQL